MSEYPFPVNVIVEAKNAMNGRWTEVDFFEVPNGLRNRMSDEMLDRFNAHYVKYRTNKKRGTIDFYYESDVETLRCYFEN
jgi:hypothetical protein